MVHAIFCAHGQLAGAMLDSVRMVYGEVNVSAVAFVPGENAADIASAEAHGMPQPVWQCITRRSG